MNVKTCVCLWLFARSTFECMMMLCAFWHCKRMRREKTASLPTTISFAVVVVASTDAAVCCRAWKSSSLLEIVMRHESTFFFFFISLDPRRKCQNIIRPWQNISTTFDRHDSKRASRTITATTHLKKTAAAERHRMRKGKREVKVYVSSSIYRNYVILSSGREQKKTTTTKKKKNVRGTFSSFSSIKSSLYRSSWFPQWESHSLVLCRFLYLRVVDIVFISLASLLRICIFSLFCCGSSVLHIIRSSISGGFHVISSSSQSDSNTL